MNSRPSYEVTLLSKRLIARDLLELRFTLPEQFSFIPGQFVQFFIPEGMEYVVRSYSIVSHPTDNYLEFCVKLVPEGKGSKFFSSLEQGGLVRFRGPEGRFVCQETHYPHKVFIATGAGIAPIMSMISDRVTTTDKIQLLFGVRAEEDIFWTERLQAWEKVSANFSFILTLSQPSSMWSGKTGRVVDYITSFVQTSLIEYYLCGSLDMVKDARVNLVGQGISTKNIHLEIF